MMLNMKLHLNVDRKKKPYTPNPFEMHFEMLKTMTKENQNKHTLQKRENNLSTVVNCID